MQSERSGDAAGVSYVVPILNEERYIAATVESIVAQDYAGPREIALVLGPCTDATPAVVARLAQVHPEIVVIDNPAGRTPVAMNLGIEATSHPVVVRVDAHATLPAHYTSTLVGALEEHDAVNAGGRMVARGLSPFQRAVAWAYNSPFGLGGGSHHRTSGGGPAETVYLGVFRRDALDAAGGYDESLARAQDWDLNRRLREAGGILWFVPEIEVEYFPRSSWTALARQFWITGRWRATLTREEPGAAPLRYFVPPALVVGLVLSVIAAIGLGCAGAPLWAVLAACGLPVLYAAGVSSIAALRARSLSVAERAWLIVVLPTMHVAWGAGNLVGLLAPMRRVATSDGDA